MWPVLTLTLLLQLTDEEQLFAVIAPPEPTPAVLEITAPPALLVAREFSDEPIG